MIGRQLVFPGSSRLSARRRRQLVAANAGKLEVRTSDAGTVTISKDSVQSLRSKEEQTAYQAGLDRLRNPGLLDLWSGAVDVGLSLTRGNADTATFTLGMAAARTTPRDKISVYAAALGGGLGFHAVKTERTALDLFGGGSLNREYFSTGLKRSSGEILVGEELTHKLSGRTSLKERLVLFTNLSQTGEYRLNFDTSAVTNLNKWLAWQVTLSDRYLSNPVPGAKKNDLLLTTGLRVTFAR